MTGSQLAVREDFAERYGRWALVTGAAQGIGAAYSEHLSALGMPLVVMDVQAERLEEQASKLRAASPGAQVRAVVVDLSDTTALQVALDSLADLQIGLLVLNAGIGAVGRWLEVPMATKIRQVAVNCTSTVMIAHHLTPAMVERRRGGVIIMASGAAEGGSSFITTYAATKAFDRVFAEGLWLELSPYGVDVTAVMPGAVRTPGFEDTLPPGFGPTKAMQPVEPEVVVDAALRGLGSRINVRTGGRVAAVLGSVMGVIPRVTRLKLGDRAVRQMYDRS